MSALMRAPQVSDKEDFLRLAEEPWQWRRGDATTELLGKSQVMTDNSRRLRPTKEEVSCTESMQKLI